MTNSSPHVAAVSGSHRTRGFASARQPTRWLPARWPTFVIRHRRAIATRWSRHLRPRYATRRLDAIEPDDVARSFVSCVPKGCPRQLVRLSWSRPRPHLPLRRTPSELGRTGSDRATAHLRAPEGVADATRARFHGEQIAQTIAAATEPWRTLFVTAALTGARARSCAASPGCT